MNMKISLIISNVWSKPAGILVSAIRSTWKLTDLEAGRCVDLQSCSQQIEESINNLHALDLVHNNVNSDNITATSASTSTLVLEKDSCFQTKEAYCPVCPHRGI